MFIMDYVFRTIRVLPSFARKRRVCGYKLICTLVAVSVFIMILLPRKRGSTMPVLAVLNDLHPKNVVAVSSPGPKGFERAASLSNLCETFGERKSKLRDNVRVSYSMDPEAMFCPMCKVASTFWTRVFKMMEFNKNLKSSVYETPFDVPISKAGPSIQWYSIASSKVSPNDISTVNPLKFLFVRSPYSMLFSAYGDKIIKPTVNFFDNIGKPAIKRLRGITNPTGSDVTFAEFVDEIVYKYRKSGRMDCHVDKFSGCRPCSVDYTFVGKLETFKQDTMDILSILKQKTTVDVFNRNFTHLHAQDAISDVTQGVFSDRRRLVQYLKWPEAVGRIWRILQIRGIINHARFPLTDEEAEHISRDDLVRLINRVKQVSKPEETKRLKKMAFIEAYRSLPSRLMTEIREIYKEEFKLFQYDETPADLFDQDRKIECHDFLNFSNVREDLKPRGRLV